MAKDLKVGMAYPAFFTSFRQFIPQLEPEIKPGDVKDFDIIVFSGGEDIDPSLYGKENEGLSWSNPDRDTREVEIFKVAWQLNKRMFGVCRGHQLINALTGGTLFQDLSLSDGGSHSAMHKLKVTGMHEFMRYVPETVNSMHHQGIDHLSSVLEMYAMWNNVPEICIGRNDSIITVQFHPEFMGDTCKYIFSWMLSAWKEPSQGLRSAKTKQASLDEIVEFERQRMRMEESIRRQPQRARPTFQGVDIGRPTATISNSTDGGTMVRQTSTIQEAAAHSSSEMENFIAELTSWDFSNEHDSGDNDGGDDDSNS